MELIDAFGGGQRAIVAYGVSTSGSGGASTNDFYFEFTQSTPLNTWTVNHNKGARPNVSVYTPGGIEVDAEVSHISINQVRVYFDNPQTGFVVCS